jgi:hypothetical protein
MMRLAFVLALAGCSSKPAMTQPDPATPPPAAPAPDPAPGSGSDGSGATPAPAQGSAAGPKIGEPCAANDVCGEGSCVTYYGIAGPRGPAFKSCEMKCDGKEGCPDGRKCITIADGPGQVCR